MRRVLGVAVAILLGAIGALVIVGRSLNVGPFALGAPASWLYVAVARGGEEAGARDIEVIDTASGERRQFGLEATIIDLALSPDRRSLYVGSERGVILEIDALRGAGLRRWQLPGSGDIQRLAVTRDGRRIVAFPSLGLEASAVLLDLDSGTPREFLTLGRRLIGKPALRGDALLVPVSDRDGFDSLLELTLDPLRVHAEVAVATARRGILQTAAPTVVTVERQPVVLSPFALRVVVLAADDLAGRREADLAPLFLEGRRPTALGPGLEGDLEVSGHTVHACVGTSARAERYRLTLDELTPERAGGECGRFGRLRDGTLFLAVRGKPELLILDQATGEARRKLPLTGFATRLVN